MTGPIAPSRPRLLDLFCGAGGAARGYQMAGFYVVGVDNRPQPRYAGDEFVLADAMTFPLDGFDAIHASPPCQDHMLTPHRKHGTGWLLSAIRERLTAQPAAWIIENVPGAKMRADFKLCGCLFDLKLRRLRFFETSWGGFDLRRPCLHLGPVVSVVGSGTPTWVRHKWIETFGRAPRIGDYRAAMGIDWMTRNELSQSIPPAYTEYIGKRLLAVLP